MGGAGSLRSDDLQLQAEGGRVEVRLTVDRLEGSRTRLDLIGDGMPLAAMGLEMI